MAEGLGLRPQTFVKCSREQDPVSTWELGRGRVVDTRDVCTCHLRSAYPRHACSAGCSGICPWVPGTAHPVRMWPVHPTDPERSWSTPILQGRPRDRKWLVI